MLGFRAVLFGYRAKGILDMGKAVVGGADWISLFFFLFSGTLLRWL